MTRVWKVAGKIAVRRVVVRRTGHAAFAMTGWSVIARTRRNAPATGTVKRRKERKPEGEEKAGREERKNPALSRRRKIFSVIFG
jgi:hypothetical protein